MLKKTPSLIALAALLTACSASAQAIGAATPASAIETTVAATLTPASYEDAPVACEVRSRRTSNGLLIQARAFADRDIDAEYDLRIVRSGGGNSSEITQAGEILLSAGDSVVLGENEISFERGSRVRAYLTLRDTHGELCHRNFRL